MEPIDWNYGEAFTDGEIVRFFVGTKTYGELWAVVDTADWQTIRDSRWTATKRKNLFYVRDGNGVLLHRVLTRFEWPVVDHRDGDGLNNRRGNLRRCESNAENSVFTGDRRRGCTKAEAALGKWLSRQRGENKGDRRRRENRTQSDL